MSLIAYLNTNGRVNIEGNGRTSMFKSIYPKIRQNDDEEEYVLTDDHNLTGYLFASVDYNLTGIYSLVKISPHISILIEA